MISDFYRALRCLQLFPPTITTSNWRYMYDRSDIICGYCGKTTISAGTILYLSPPELQTVILSPRRALIELNLRCGLYSWQEILHEQAGHPWIYGWSGQLWMAGRPSMARIHRRPQTVEMREKRILSRKMNLLCSQTGFLVCLNRWVASVTAEACSQCLRACISSYGGAGAT